MNADELGYSSALFRGASLRMFTHFTKKYLKFPYFLLCCVAALFIFDFNWLLLAGLPLICLGWFCAAPNLNFSDGFLANAVAVILLLVGLVLGPRIFLQLGAITWLAWIGCSLEIAWRIETKRKGFLGKG